ncbi:MAG TPA: HAMP domain-containing sensor histidine kinase [Vicinamibacterales bacterium]
MTLERRLVVLSVLVALPVAGVVVQSVAWLRARDLLAALERVVTAQINAQLQERCEADPTWFLTGMLDGRPAPTDPKPGPDELPARPHLDPQPYQLFAYDDDFVPSSPVGVRFPTAFKNAMRAGAPRQAGPYDAPNGDGAEFAVRTGWTGGPCAVLLGRMDAPPDERFDWWAAFLGVEALFSAVFIALATPTVRRIQSVSRSAQEAARSEWTVVTPCEGHDELTAVGAALNEASADLRRRIKDVSDRENGHRRFVARTASEIGEPLETLAATLTAGTTEPAAAMREAHDLSVHLGNLLVAARLRMHLGQTALEAVDVAAIITAVVARQSGLAKRNGVSLDATVPATSVRVMADPKLVEQALLNLVDNAVRYNRPGGRVTVSLAHTPDGFVLRVTDNGPGVSDEQLASMSAIRRFRGDEGHVDRVRQRGLGLALVWEVVERSGFQLELRHVSGGGLDAEMTGTRLVSSDLPPLQSPDASPGPPEVPGGRGGAAGPDRLRSGRADDGLHAGASSHPSRAR